MFDNLSNKFGDIFRNMRGMGKLSEKNIKEVVREVKMALLEADVDYKVVKQIVKDVQDRVLGQDVLRSVLPDQQFVKIVHDELTSIMGNTHAEIAQSTVGPTVIMMVGIQGSGKTTACGKLAHRFKQEKKKTLLVACDVYRPAAIKQLQVLAKRCEIDIYADERQKNPVKIAEDAMDFSRHKDYDYIILDTAGRLEMDEDLMNELSALKMEVKPHEVLFVADAMMGQSSLQVAQGFNQKIGVDGVVLTKIDGDARGGVALSVRQVLDTPVKFVGVGENLGDLEPFHPDRMASRILGMGDVVSLLEKAHMNMSEDETRRIEKKMRKNGLDLTDFLQQLQQIKKMGSLKDLIGMLPGGNQLKNMPLDDKQITRVEAIILSMTPYERENPYIIKGPRRKRIAAGSGTHIQDVNRMLKQFDMMNKMMKKMGSGKMSKKLMSQMKNMPMGR